MFRLTAAAGGAYKSPMISRIRFLILATAAAIVAVAPIAAAAPKGTGLPLPRFVSLRADTVNMRTGPGVQYPVGWVFQRRELPVEVIAEYRTWRKVRDWQGAEGWMHSSMLGGARTIIVTGTIATLRADAANNARPVARAEPGAIGRLKGCPEGLAWCRVEIGGRDGWLERTAFWGVYAGEVVE